MSVCVWCGLPSGEVPRSCENHGKPKSVVSVSLPADHFDRIYADALAKITGAVKPRAACVHMSCTTSRCEEGQA